jgi:hypothetical protein
MPGERVRHVFSCICQDRSTWYKASSDTLRDRVSACLEKLRYEKAVETLGGNECQLSRRS